MAAYLQKARRTAILRRARLDFERDRALEHDVTPPPVAVVEGPEPVSAPPVSLLASPVSRVGAPRRGWKRLLLGLAALALFGAGSAALTGASRPVRSAPASAPAGVVTQALGAAPFPELPGAPESLPPPPAPRSEPAAPPPAAPPPVTPRADAHLKRDGHGSIPGGVLFVPETFSSADGAYDLYLHFHGNTRVVLESAEHAGLNAIVAIVNLGINSAPYLDTYEVPGMYERTLASVARVVAERGLAGAHLRRVAIGSWSGGYGAVSRILEHDTGTASLDAVFVLDGIHCGFLDDNPKELNALIISPFLRGAKRAAEGKLLFSITHSEIDPIAYAGTTATSDYLLDAVHGRRDEPGPPPEHVQIKAAEGAVSRRLEKRMEPTSEALVGSFHVRGYRGNTPEHHMAHLLQMAATVLPELVDRWRDAPR